MVQTDHGRIWNKIFVFSCLHRSTKRRRTRHACAVKHKSLIGESTSLTVTRPYSNLIKNVNISTALLFQTQTWSMMSFSMQREITIKYSMSLPLFGGGLWQTFASLLVFALLTRRRSVHNQEKLSWNGHSIKEGENRLTWKHSWRPFTSSSF